MTPRPHAPRSKACEVCQQPFIVLRMGQKVCGAKCAVKHAKALRAKGKKELRERKRELQTIPELKEEAQKWFRKFIRLRDRELPCVSCGINDPPMTVGGQWDAGHFLSRGAYPELAFDEDNCHKQCKSCNGGGGKFKHKERTVNERYEEELLRRIGPARLAKLKGPHPVEKRTREELIGLAETYKAKVKELEKRNV